MKLETFKEKIDQYIETRIDLLLKKQLQNVVEGALFPMAQAFMERTLKHYIKEMVREGVAEALTELSSEFDLDMDMEFDTSQDFSTDFYPSNLKEPEVSVKVGVSADAIRLLAFLQVYREEHGPDSVPPPSKIWETLGFSAIDLTKLYLELEEEGWITRPSSGIKNKITINKPVPDPNSYLEN